MHHQLQSCNHLLNFENIVYGWAMDAIKKVPDEQILEEKKMKRILNDMMNRQDLEKVLQ